MEKAVAKAQAKLDSFMLDRAIDWGILPKKATVDDLTIAVRGKIIKHLNGMVAGGFYYIRADGNIGIGRRIYRLLEGKIRTGEYSNYYDDGIVGMGRD